MRLISLTAALACLPAFASGATTVTAITHETGLAVANTSSGLTSLTAGGTTFSLNSLVPVIDGFNVNGNTGGLFEGTGDPLPIPSGAAGVGEVFNGLDIVNGKANSVEVDAFFALPVIDTNFGDANFAIFEVAAGTQTDPWTIQAIVGGTPGAAVLGGTALTIADQSTVFGDTGTNISFRRNAGESLNQDLLGAAFDFADFGLAPTTQVLGLRVTTANGDPTLIVAIIPEPSRGLLLSAGFGLLLLRRRR